MNENITAQNQTPSMSKSRKFFFWSLTIVLILVVCFIFTELLLHWLIPYPLGTNQSAISQIDPVLGWSIESNYNLTFVGADKTFSFKRSNHVGTLGPDIHMPKLTGTLRVLVTGDSHIHSSLSESKTFTAHLRRTIKNHEIYRTVDVVNGAVAGYSPYQQLLRTIYLNTAIQPDAIIVCLYGGNDFSDLELSDGPLINDYYHGRTPVNFDKPRFAIYQRSGDDHQSLSIIKFIKPYSRFFDLIGFFITQYQHSTSWDRIKDKKYTLLKNGPLYNLSQDEIREIIPDRNAYHIWSSWYTQGAKQNQYFYFHPERLSIARIKMRAILAAFGVLKSQLNIPIHILYIPTVLSTKINEKAPFNRFNETLEMRDISTDQKSKELIQTWTKQAKLTFWDGEKILRDKLEEDLWFNLNDSHLTAEAQKILAQAFIEAFDFVPIVERVYKYPPNRFLSNLPSNERAFAYNPQPSFPTWMIPTMPTDHKKFSIQLQRYIALSTPGPWEIGTVWKWSNKPRKNLKVYQVLWDTQTTPYSRIYRVPSSIDVLQSMEQTFWIQSGWYNKTKIPSLPNAISLESATGERLTSIYSLKWQ